MGRPRKLPDADGLHQLRVVEGKSYQEIAEQFGVTREAVRLALTQARLTKPRPRYTDEIPWTVAVEHSSDYRLSMLRMAARLERGLPVPEYKARYVRNWINNLSKPRPGAPNGVVVDYDRDFYPDGFAYVPREPDDAWLIRKPDEQEEPAKKSGGASSGKASVAPMLAAIGGAAAVWHKYGDQVLAHM